MDVQRATSRVARLTWNLLEGALQQDQFAATRVLLSTQGALGIEPREAVSRIEPPQTVGVRTTEGSFATRVLQKEPFLSSLGQTVDFQV
jgi:hypothetical protein